MYKNILLAIDGSENSRRAGYEAARLALDDTVNVTILHVMDPDDTQKDVVRSTTERHLNKQKKDTLSSIIRFFGEQTVDHEYVVRRGLPARKIIEEANTGKYDVLVIGSRGLNIFQEMVLGSVSHKVAKRATIPVMIVK
ncbi:universal stress protein [Salinicoccus sp. ID82-1]|uniref:universal stress protein n=1 Tax=Salinicoccus sp. ID82-1 TaxID=2820269 RepID=UPI001F308C39|nr:universal stress protein [Salinicoccus sp. ID82-1]MCG1010349.1 universal stress protein [Salinicoccus sp. ID82-1]